MKKLMSLVLVLVLATTIVSADNYGQYIKDSEYKTNPCEVLYLEYVNEDRPSDLSELVRFTPLYVNHKNKECKQWLLS